MEDAASFRVLCKNKDCHWARKLDKPIEYKPTENYIPLYNNLIEYCCGCSSSYFEEFDVTEDGYRKEGAKCFNLDKGIDVFFGQNEIFCEKEDCMYNNCKYCDRHIILVSEDFNGWCCSNFSLKGVRGRIDWSNFPKGGHVDDAYSEVLDKDNRKAKLFMNSSKGSGLREERPRSKKPKLPVLPPNRRKKIK